MGTCRLVVIMKKKQFNRTIFADHERVLAILHQRLMYDPNYIEQLEAFLMQSLSPRLSAMEERLERLEQVQAKRYHAEAELPVKSTSLMEDGTVTQLPAGSSDKNDHPEDADQPKRSLRPQKPQEVEIGLMDKTGLSGEDELPDEDEFIDRRHFPPRVKPAGVREIHRQFALRRTDRQIGELLGLNRKTINKRRHKWERMKAEDKKPIDDS
jgi:hypothetical protein